MNPVMPMKPRPALLRIWRICLIIAAMIPAFLISLFCTVPGTTWIILTACWVVLFLLCYLWFLPVLYRRKSWRLEPNRLTLTGGIFYSRSYMVPIEAIQYVTCLVSPLDHVFHLASLVVVSAGGRVMLPGMSQKDAEAMMDVMTEKLLKTPSRPED